MFDRECTLGLYVFSNHPNLFTKKSLLFAMLALQNSPSWQNQGPPRLEGIPYSHQYNYVPQHVYQFGPKPPKPLWKILFPIALLLGVYTSLELWNAKDNQSYEGQTLEMGKYHYYHLKELQPRLGWGDIRVDFKITNGGPVDIYFLSIVNFTQEAKNDSFHVNYRNTASVRRQLEKKYLNVIRLDRDEQVWIPNSNFHKMVLVIENLDTPYNDTVPTGNVKYDLKLSRSPLYEIPFYLTLGIFLLSPLLLLCAPVCVPIFVIIIILIRKHYRKPRYFTY